MDSSEINVSAVQKLKLITEELECSICRSNVHQAYTTSCSHSFCVLCINHWFDNYNDKECPFCRQHVSALVRCRVLDNIVAILKNDENAEIVSQETQQISVNCINNTQNNSFEQQLPDPMPVSHFSDTENESNDAISTQEESELEFDFISTNDSDDNFHSFTADNEQYSVDAHNGNPNTTDAHQHNGEHARKCNQNNPNNDEYWRLRGWLCRPNHWRELYVRIKKCNRNNPNNDEYWQCHGWTRRPDNWRELLRFFNIRSKRQNRILNNSTVSINR